MRETLKLVIRRLWVVVDVAALQVRGDPATLRDAAGRGRAEAAALEPASR